MGANDGLGIPVGAFVARPRKRCALTTHTSGHVVTRERGSRGCDIAVTSAPQGKRGGAGGWDFQDWVGGFVLVSGLYSAHLKGRHREGHRDVAVRVK